MEMNNREDGCYFCGRHDALQRHHIFGAYNRNHSEEDGLVVWLCMWCHTEPHTGVHRNKERRRYLQMKGQAKYEETHTREEFVERYGKNYL